MGVGPDGACGGSSGGGDSCAHDTAAATRASASETGARTLVMAAGWYHAADAREFDARSTVATPRWHPLNQLNAGRLQAPIGAALRLL